MKARRALRPPAPLSSTDRVRLAQRYTSPHYGDGEETCMACRLRVLPGDALCAEHKRQRTRGALNVDIVAFVLHWTTRGYADAALSRVSGLDRRMIEEVRNAEDVPSAGRLVTAPRWACSLCGRFAHKQVVSAPRCACGERMKRMVTL